jgi:hypothetical protein
MAASTDIMRILEQIRDGEIDPTAAEEVIKAAAAKAAASKGKEITSELSPKKGIMFKGFRKFPITVFVEELEMIVRIYNTPKFQEFLSTHEDRLSRKGLAYFYNEE